MTIAEAFLYGLVQGVTEYLPISSSAHLILFPRFLAMEDPGLTFNVFLHVGTLFSTLVFFWKDWLNVLAGVPRLGEKLAPAQYQKLGETGRKQSWFLFILLCAATVPTLIAGAALHSYAETIFRGTRVLIFSLSIGGICLWAADHFAPKNLSIPKMGIKQAIWMGVAQSLAIVPGVSRSGATITGGRLIGLNREAAAKFSFLMSMPIILAAVVFEMRNWQEILEGSGAYQWAHLLVGCLSAFAFGLVAIGGLLQLLKRFGYLSFAIYRIGLAILIYYLFGLG